MDLSAHYTEIATSRCAVEQLAQGAQNPLLEALY
jgi:hypothetical protein